MDSPNTTNTSLAVHNRTRSLWPTAQWFAPGSHGRSHRGADLALLGADGVGDLFGPELAAPPDPAGLRSLFPCVDACCTRRQPTESFNTLDDVARRGPVEPAPGWPTRVTPSTPLGCAARPAALGEALPALPAALPFDARDCC